MSLFNSKKFCFTREHEKFERYIDTCNDKDSLKRFWEIALRASDWECKRHSLFKQEAMFLWGLYAAELYVVCMYIKKLKEFCLYGGCWVSISLFIFFLFVCVGIAATLIVVNPSVRYTWNAMDLMRKDSTGELKFDYSDDGKVKFLQLSVREAWELYWRNFYCNNKAQPWVFRATFCWVASVIMIAVLIIFVV